MKKLPVVLVLLVLAGCSELRVFEPISEAAREQAFLIQYGFWLMMIVLAVVTVLFILFVIKYKETAKNKDDVPSEIDSNLKLELSWTIFPIIILVALAIPTVMITYNSSPTSSADYAADTEGVHINVTAMQFSWQFEYENGLVSVNEVVVPVGETAIFHLTSEDVIHSFWVPEFGGKQDAIPGKEIIYEITPEEIGVFSGQCAEFCGIEHADMEFTAKVVSREEYEAFLTDNDQNGGNSDDN